MYSIFSGLNYLFIDLGCVGNDNTAGDGTDRGSCYIGELCTAAGTCLGTYFGHNEC